MQDLTMQRGRIEVNMKVIDVGQDLCVIISGGDSPHIGCVTLSVPRPSLSIDGETSATTSILNLLGHKDDEAAKYVTHTLASRLNKNVVVTCGIHIDSITNEEINIVVDILRELADKLIDIYI